MDNWSEWQAVEIDYVIIGLQVLTLIGIMVSEIAAMINEENNDKTRQSDDKQRPED